MSGPIFISDEERTAVQYFSSLNHVGAIGIGIGVTLLQFKKPENLAMVAIVLFSLWALHQGYEYKRMLRRSHPAARPGVFMLLRHGWLYVIAIALFASILTGILSGEMFT